MNEKHENQINKMQLEELEEFVEIVYHLSIDEHFFALKFISKLMWTKRINIDDIATLRSRIKEQDAEYEALGKIVKDMITDRRSSVKRPSSEPEKQPKEPRE